MGRKLIFEVHWGYTVIFVTYGWLVSFTFIRVIGALFLKQVLAAAAVDPEATMLSKEKERRRLMRQLRELFEEADSDGGGLVHKEEFIELLRKPRAKTLLSILEVDSSDIERLWHLLDDGDGTICIEEFVKGVMKVRGQAKAMDVVTILYHHEHAHESMKR